MWKNYNNRCFAIILFTLFVSKSLFAKENWNKWNLGPIGVMGEVKKGSPVFKIITVKKGTPGARAGLLSKDLIIAVNGKKFETTTFIPQDGGKGPLETLGYSIDKAEGTNGILNLTIIRDDKTSNSPKELIKKVQLEVIGAFSSTYPFNCQKSLKLLEQCCEKICREAGSSRTTTMALGGLALLAAGPVKYNKTIKQIRDTLLMRVNNFQGAYNWIPGYVGIFLAEYYMLNKSDKKVFKAMEILVRLTEKRIMGTGSFGYGNLDSSFRARPVNSAGTTVFWFWALAKRCGVKIDEDRFHLAAIYLTLSTKSDGGIRYNYHAGGYDNGSKTANAAIAFNIIGRDALKKLSLRKTVNLYNTDYVWSAKELDKASKDMKQRDIAGANTDYLIKHLKVARENHVTMSLGMLSIPAALSFDNDRKKLRQWMDYWKWFLRLSIGPENDVYYHGNNQSHMGDRQLGQDRIAPIVYALILSVGQRHLQSQGNRSKARFGPTYTELYVKGTGIDRKAGLKAFFQDKMTEILEDTRELKDAFDLFNEKQETTDGKALLEELTKSILSKLNYLRKFSIIRPITAYKQLKKYETAFSKEAKLNRQIKSILAQNENSVITSYLRIEQEYDKIVNSDHITDKSRGLKQILSKYKALLKRKTITPELRFEIEESITALNVDLPHSK